jgi:hypothetical protein
MSPDKPPVSQLFRKRNTQGITEHSIVTDAHLLGALKVNRLTFDFQ